MEHSSSYLTWARELNLGEDESILSWRDYLTSPECKISSILALPKAGHFLDDFDEGSIKEMEVYPPLLAKRASAAVSAGTGEGAGCAPSSAALKRVNTEALGPVLVALRKMQWAGWKNPFITKFTRSNVAQLGIPGYFTRVSEPMDLTRLQEDVKKGAFSSPARFEAKLRLIEQNAVSFNGPSHIVSTMAGELVKEWDTRLRASTEERWSVAAARHGLVSSVGVDSGGTVKGSRSVPMS